MNNLIGNYKIHKIEKFGWIESVRASFDCDNIPSTLKIWELWLIVCVSFLKETLNLLINTFSSNKTGLVGLFSNVYPLNVHLFWILLLKLGAGYILLIYLTLKHKGSATVWRIWTFWAISIFFPLINSLESKYEIINGIADVIKLGVLFLFFLYFFLLDKVHLNSLKLLLYDELTIDTNTGKLYRTPRSRISSEKLKKLGISTFIIIGASMILMIWATRLISLIEMLMDMNKGPGGSGKSGTSQKPKNQEQLENIFRSAPIRIIISACLMAPILEEWVYRRFLMKAGQFKWWTIPLSGFVFGLVHLKEGEGMLTMIPYVLPGIVFATAMYTSKNIWHSIIAHSIYNTLTIIKMAASLSVGYLSLN